ALIETQLEKNTTFRQVGGLISGTQSAGLIRVDVLAEFARPVGLEHLLNLGNASGATDDNERVDFGQREASGLEDILQRPSDALVQQVSGDRFELFPRDH